MLVYFVTLSVAQSLLTEETKEAVDRLLDHCDTNLDSKIILHSREMKLRINSDASYLSELHARSRAGGNFFLGTQNFIDTS